MDACRTISNGMHPIPRVTATRHATANRSDRPSIEAAAIRAMPSGARAITASRIATRETDSGQGSHRCENETLGGELPEQVAGRGAQAQTQRHLAAAAGRARRQQPAQVDHRDEQQHDRAGEQQRRDAPAVSQNVLAQRRKRRDSIPGSRARGVAPPVARRCRRARRLPAPGTRPGADARPPAGTRSGCSPVRAACRAP